MFEKIYYVLFLVQIPVITYWYDLISFQRYKKNISVYTNISRNLLLADDTIAI